MAEAFLGPADSVLDGVLVQRQPFCGGLVAAAGVEEHQQGLAQPGVLLVVGGELPERAAHPRAQQFLGSEHHRHRRDLRVAHHGRRGTSGQRDRLGGEGLPVGEPEPGDALRHVAERDVKVAVEVGRAGRGGVEPVPDPERQPRPRA
jgi:hypothetical protein